MSCSPNPRHCGGSGGCQGSTQQLGFNYTITAGITTDADYPYQGETGKCKTSEIKPVAGIKGYVTVQPNNYTALAAAVATKGPVAITVAAGGIGWQIYKFGVRPNPKRTTQLGPKPRPNLGRTLDGGNICPHWKVFDGLLGIGCGYTLDHGVQVVGYGTQGKKGYWWVRNSWGSLWGEGGYMKLARFGEGNETTNPNANG